MAAHHARVRESNFGRLFANSKLLLGAGIPYAEPGASQKERSVLRSEIAAQATGL